MCMLIKIMRFMSVELYHNDMGADINFVKYFTIRKPQYTCNTYLKLLSAGHVTYSQSDPFIWSHDYCFKLKCALS